MAALLRYAPPSLYDDFVKRFSPKTAAVAFGNEQKAHHLRKQQRLGIEYIRSNKNAFVLEHSELQCAYLVRDGVDPSRIRKLTPPINFMSRRYLSTPNVPALIRRVIFNELFLFTAVARLDMFINVELLIDSGVELLRCGLTLNTFVVGDHHCQDAWCFELLHRIPSNLVPPFSPSTQICQRRPLWSIHCGPRTGDLCLSIPLRDAWHHLVRGGS